MTLRRFYRKNGTVSRATKDSPQNALMLEATQQLEIYKERHGRYPGSLDALHFTYPDGGNSSTLATLKYETDGSHYTIVAKGEFDGTVYKESR